MKPGEREALQSELDETYAALRAGYHDRQQQPVSLDEARRNRLQLF